MKRTFNFTGNINLDGCFLAFFDESHDPFKVTAKIDSQHVDKLNKFNSEFEVILAASDVLQSDYKVGTLAEVIASNGFSIVLKDFFQGSAKPRVDLRIVDLSTKKIVASAKDIVPDISSGLGRRSFVKLSVSHAIGKEIWRVRWSPTDSVPLLQLNAAVPDVERKFTERSQLGTVIMPQVLRQILHIMLMSNYDEESHVHADSSDLILSFCQKLIKSDPPPIGSRDFNDVAAWVDQVVAKFSEKIDAANYFHYPPETSNLK